MVPLTERTQELLRTAGWAPGRGAGTEQIEELRRLGFCVSPAAVAFLCEFGGLRVKFLHPRLQHPTWFSIDPLWAAGALMKADIVDYARLIGEPDLVPAGQLDDNVVLLMGPSGTVYGVFDDIIMQYGENGYQALECLCRERRATRLRT